MSSNRALITGASGLLGRSVLTELEQSDRWEALGLAFSRAKGNLLKVDLTDSEKVINIIEEFKPSVIIHCAAERRPDKVEKEEDATKALNVTATEHICKVAAQYGIFVLYMSTDYVFDGKNPPYRESDAPQPLNKYGESKLEGERVTMAASPGNMVLRVPILYGPVEFVEESAVTIIFKNVINTSVQCALSNYERRFPTDVRDVAAVMRQLLEKRAEDPSLCGYFHWSGDENMTKYDMAKAMAEVFGFPIVHITADNKPSGGAPRPYDAHLDSSRIEQLGICIRTPFKEAIVPCLQDYVKKG